VFPDLNDHAFNAPPDSPAAVDLLVLGGTIVTMDQTRRVIDDGGIAVSRAHRRDWPTREIEVAYTSRQRINAAGKVITPGLINGHTHVPMVLFRGLADDLDLQEWLTKYIFRLRQRTSRRSLFASGRVKAWRK
jgi:5-methylthioadenosine/S-adenosylhomocysteine deaminase